jgi:hypothetical protein
MKGDGDGAVAEAKAKLYRMDTATRMYTMLWSHPDIFTAVHTPSRYMTVPSGRHMSEHL